MLVSFHSVLPKPAVQTVIAIATPMNNIYVPKDIGTVPSSSLNSL